jgi:beta-phosphoglucomutase-like phosphatase (HAD superfamily)
MIEALLCDADGNLFPSEEPAFEASARVTNAFLRRHGIAREYSPSELRLATTGRNFRTTAADLAAAHGVDPIDLELWVERERREVTAHLGAVLRPDARVRDPLRRIAAHHTLCAVSSSALSRLAACFRATGLDALFPPEMRFSAEDSLAVPSSKPDPAIYELACARLDIRPDRALAIEDAVPGVESAVGAGIETIGNLVFVPEAERDEREAALLAAGAASVVRDWPELEGLLRGAVYSDALDRAS